MKNLLTFQEKLLHSTGTTPSPWKPIRPPFLTPIKNPYLPPKTRNLAAGSKGFGTANSGKRKTTKYKEPDSPKQRNEEEGGGGGGGKIESDEKIPDEVLERVLLRILVSVGVPVVIGLSVLKGFSVVKEQNLWQVPLWLPILALFLSFGASVLGIAYGSLSTSWDIEDKGSTLGFEEFQKNWAEMWKETDDQQ